METNQPLLQQIFEQLDRRIEELNRERLDAGALMLEKCEVTLLGQMSLLANEKAALVLALAQTGDMDAKIAMDYVIKEEMKKLLALEGLVYDEDSHLIWIPPASKYEPLFQFRNVTVKAIDAESALVSKAVKAPEKNKQLIRAAIVSGKFPGLVARLQKHGGKLENFL